MAVKTKNTLILIFLVLAALVLSLAVAAWFVFLGPAWLEERWESLRRKRLDRSRGGK